jgi:hypothetical protein
LPFQVLEKTRGYFPEIGFCMPLFLNDFGLALGLRNPRRGTRKMQTGAKKKRARGSQDELVSAMLEPGFYPKRPEKITHKETHISHVFNRRSCLWVKKVSVFTDYSTLGKRRHFSTKNCGSIAGWHRRSI